MMADNELERVRYSHEELQLNKTSRTMNDNASQTESEHRSRSFNRCLLGSISYGGNGEHLRQETFLGIHTLQCLFMYEACINI